eukprot:3354731-Lingulodinium_polyedra.AAC.1
MLSGVRITQKAFKDGTHDNVIDDWIDNEMRHPAVKHWTCVSFFFLCRDATTSVVDRQSEAPLEG